MKRIAFLAVFISVAAAGFTRGGEKMPSAEGRPAAADAWKKRTFTPEELGKYVGKKGLPVYVAVDGIIYDVTKSRSWKTGRHMNQHNSGVDLSDAIRTKAPAAIHKGGKILERFPKVGVLVLETPAAGPEPVAEGKNLVIFTQAQKTGQGELSKSGGHKTGKYGILFQPFERYELQGKGQSCIHSGR